MRWWGAVLGAFEHTQNSRGWSPSGESCWCLAIQAATTAFPKRHSTSLMNEAACKLYTWSDTLHAKGVKFNFIVKDFISSLYLYVLYDYVFGIFNPLSFLLFEDSNAPTPPSLSKRLTAMP